MPPLPPYDQYIHPSPNQRPPNTNYAQYQPQQQYVQAQQQQQQQYVHPQQLYQQNGHHDVHVAPKQAGSESRKFVAPTLHQAIPFIPFTSIVPFPADTLPLPGPPQRTAPRLFHNASEHEQGRKLMINLNNDLKLPHRPANILQVLDGCRRLLEPNDLPEYQFATPPPAPTKLQDRKTNGSEYPEPARFRLSNLAQLVMANSEIAYRYPTPVSEKKGPLQVINKQESTTPHPEASPRAKAEPSSRTIKSEVIRTPQTPKVVIQGGRSMQQQASSQPSSTPSLNQANFRGNQGVQAQPTKQAYSHPVVQIKPHAPPPVQPIQQPVVQIRPNVPSPAQLGQQTNVQIHPMVKIPQSSPSSSQAPPSTPSRAAPHPQVVIPSSSQISNQHDGPSILSQARIRDTEAFPDLSFDQRERAGTALGQFNESIIDLLDQADRFDDSYTQTQDMFLNGVSTVSGQPVLSQYALQRLSKSVVSLISSSAVGGASIEDLVALQKLCVSTVGVAESTNLMLGNEPSDGDVEEWFQRIELVEGSLQAARILLRLMNAGREEKQLYSEDVLGPIVRALEIVLDMLVIPIVESRSSNAGTSNFKVYQQNKKRLGSTVQLFGKVLRNFGDLIAKTTLGDTPVVKGLYLATRMIFVENAHAEKDACLGIQRYENLRRVAMDVLARIFGRYPDQRSSIFGEILSSLEKLPVARQSARHFKIVDGKSIQLVSALLMRLIQTSAIISKAGLKASKKAAAPQDPEEGDEDEDDSDAEGEDEEYDPKSSSAPASKATSSLEEAVSNLRGVVDPLFEDSWQAARQIGQYLVQRAFKTTKTGDEPYRNLLDLFTEDFLNVLGSPDWPAAELILRALALTCVSITRDDKQSVPVKNAAIDLIGLMGSGICDLQAYIRRAGSGIEMNRTMSYLVSQLSQEGNTHEAEMTTEDGPFAIVVGYLQYQGLTESQTLSAKAYHLVQWGKRCIEQDQDAEARVLGKELVAEVIDMVSNPGSLHSGLKASDNSLMQARLAAGVIALRSQFCTMQNSLLTTVLSFMTSQQPTLRNRSLKSALQLIEKDSGILDRGSYALSQILKCAGDASSLVRDSALQLLARCLVLKPSLEKQAYQRILIAIDDEATSVRKRAIKVLKDIYLRNKDEEVRIAIASGLLSRINDPEDSVAELVRQTIDEIWIVPAEELQKGEDKVETLLAYQQVASTMVKTTQRTDAGLASFEALLESMLKGEAPRKKINIRVCKDIVTAMFDAIIDNEDRPGKPSQQNLALVLTAFAKIRPKLFASEQVSMLEAYIRNLTNDNLSLYRSVLIIFRHVFPTLSSKLGSEFLGMVQRDLMGSLTKLPKQELPVTAACLSIICTNLEDDSKLVTLLKSILQQANQRRDMDLARPDNVKAGDQARRYLQLIGAFGKEHDFEAHLDIFKAVFLDFKGSSVSALIVDILFAFTRKGQSKTVRQAALEGIGMVCQTWPQNYLRADVNRAFEAVFINNESDLQLFVMTGFRDFLANEELRSKSGAAIKVGEGAKNGQERLAGSFVATNNDGATTTIAQTFLDHIVRIALCHVDESALVATQIIASINRQGLLHPKQCGPPLVALATSKNAVIAKMAVEEHGRLHHKHESMFEKEYMRAVQQAYEYQRDVYNDPRGVIGLPSRPKMGSVFEVLKTGSAKVRRRFLDNLCARIDFDLPTLDTNGKIPDKVLFARFALENLAFFEYPRVDEVLGVVTALEGLVIKGTGTTVAHALEIEVLKMHIVPSSEPGSEFMPSQGAAQTVSSANGFMDTVMSDASESSRPSEPIRPGRERQLAVASMIMSIAWETRTHLRNLWGLAKLSKPGTKLSAKDLNKAPTKVPFVQADKYLDKVSTIMRALTTPELQLAQCQAYAELLNIDHEVRVGAGADDADADGDVLDGSEDDQDGPSPVKGMKRKLSASVTGSPRKKRGRPPGVKNKDKGSVGASSQGKKRRSKSRGDSDEELSVPWF